MLVGYFAKDGLKVWEVKKKEKEVREVKTNKKKLSVSQEAHGRFAYVNLYSLTGTSCVCVSKRTSHSIYDFDGVKQGTKPQLVQNFEAQHCSTFSYSHSQNIILSTRGVPSESDLVGTEIIPLEVSEFGPDLKPRKKNVVNIIFKKYRRKSTITQLELGETLKNQVIVGAYIKVDYEREIACLFDLETGKEVCQLRGCYHNSSYRSLHYDDQRQLLFAIGDRDYIDGGLSAWDFRSNSEVFKKNELGKLSRTYRLSIIGDDLWTGTVKNNDMYGDTESEEDDDVRTKVKVFDLRKLKVKKSFKRAHKNDIKSIVHLKSSDLCCSCSTDGYLKFYCIKELKELKELEMRNEGFTRKASVCSVDFVNSNMKMMMKDLEDRVSFLLSCYLEENGKNTNDCGEKNKNITIKLVKSGWRATIPKIFL